MIRIVSNLIVNEKKIVENLYITKGQIFAEFVLEALIKKAECRIAELKQTEYLAKIAIENNVNNISELFGEK